MWTADFTAELPDAGTSWKDRSAAGREFRKRCPRSAHAEWKPADSLRDPVAVLEHSNQGRLADLIPIRHGRMMRSRLAFFRGLPSLMIADLSRRPVSGIPSQICGDCHLENLGWFASPERNLIFDVNDFDETLVGPWEWDVFRIAVSLAIAARDKQAPRETQDRIVRLLMASYRKHIAKLSQHSTLELWYQRLDSRRLIKSAKSEDERDILKSVVHSASQRTVQKQMKKLTEHHAGKLRIRDSLPKFFHATESGNYLERTQRYLQHYRETLASDRRELFDRFRVLDAAYKIVGVGSVGLRCGIVLMTDGDDHPFFLQLKEARRSLLADALPKISFPDHQGQRVVEGQRLMQAASDVFLGWTRDDDGRDYYVRQLRDMKTSVSIGGLSLGQLGDHAELCGWALARAHAKAGRGPEIAGYLGDEDNFDWATVEFSRSYADQVDRDYHRFLQAISDHRIPAQIEGDDQT